MAILFIVNKKIGFTANLISSGEFLEACFDKIDKIPKVGYLAACCGVIH
jgi:hypothetical protein